MAVQDIARVPPIVQIAGLGLLAVYVVSSIVGRLSPRFRGWWRDPHKRHRFGHVFEYTLVPAAVLAGASALVVYNWDYRLPLDGGWMVTDLVFGPGAALLGAFLIAAAAVLGRDADETSHRALRSWLPFILVTGGIALLSIGVFRFGRVVKEKHRVVAPVASDQAPGSGGPVYRASRLAVRLGRSGPARNACRVPFAPPLA